MVVPYYENADGSVKIYHADCLDVLKELEAGSVDFIFTDPPYGHNNNDGDLIHRWESALGKGPHGESRAIANDGPEANDLFRNVLPELNRLLAPGCCCCCCCCCCGGGPDPQFARWSLWMDEVMQFKQMVVWDKGPMGMGWHYRRSYETVLVAQKKGAACRWFDTTDKVENIIRRIGKIIPNKADHPTPKPIRLVTHFLQLHTQAGDIVLDPFMGHSPVGVACVQTGRKFIGIEIDEGYCKIAEKRIRDAEKQLRLL
jgi:DNA modification methylase